MARTIQIVAAIAAGVSANAAGSARQPAPAPAAAPAPAPLRGVEAVKRDAAAVMELVKTDAARAFCASAVDLPTVGKRTIYYPEDRSAYFNSAQAARMPEGDRAALQSRELDEHFYYHTRYGTPVAYARAIDVLYALRDTGAVAGVDAKLDPASMGPTGARIMDFGAGGLASSRMLASLGADVTAVDVDPSLAACFSEPSDTGIVPLSRAGVQKIGMSGNERMVGKAQLLTGRWPAEPGIRETVGGGYDLIFSKNTLKRGYLHPEREVDKRRLLDLGVPDEEYVRALHEALKPGGVVMVYNICPAQAAADKPYLPHADGHSPFAREQWEKAGFRVVAFDVDDSKAVREMARALGWDTGPRPMDLENDLFAWFTVVQKGEQLSPRGLIAP